MKERRQNQGNVKAQKRKNCPLVQLNQLSGTEIIGSGMAQTLWDLERGVCIWRVHMWGMCVFIYTENYTVDISIRLNVDLLYMLQNAKTLTSILLRFHSSVCATHVWLQPKTVCPSLSVRPLWCLCLSKYKPTQLPILTAVSVYTGRLNMIFTFSHKACILTEHVFLNKDFLCLKEDWKELTDCHFTAFLR